MLRCPHGGAAVLLALFAAPRHALRMEPFGEHPVDRTHLINVALTRGEPPQGGIAGFQLEKIVKRHGNGSAATQGKLFQMEKVRSYGGPWPDWSAAKKGGLSAPAAPKECRGVTKWAVVTSIFLPTEAIEALGHFPPSWCTVVVGDLKGPQQGEYLPAHPRVVHLSSKEQRGLKWRSAEQLPWNSFGRKNLGYLYAAAQGAEVIFDFDDDNVPRKGLDALAEALVEGGERLEARLLQGAPYANVYPLFTEGNDNVWPRGFPLQGIREEPPAETVMMAASGLPATDVGVVQSLAQGNPDVDAVYRLTGKLPVTFSADAPLAVLQRGTFSPFNAQATLWRRPAFLALLLPVTVHGRVADIWRSFIAQPLLWQRNLSLAFASPQVEVKQRNEHELMADLEAEWPLYYEVHGLLMHLAEAHRDASSAEEALFATYVDLYEHGILQEADVALVAAWTQDMLALTAGSSALALNEMAEDAAAEEMAEEVKRTVGTRPPESRVALHMHFNWPEFWDSAVWYLEQTEICHPRNFALCTFVSDWSNNEEAKTQLPKRLGRVSKHGTPVRLVDCPENAYPGRQHGGYMYKCFARSMELIFAPGQEWAMPTGLLVLADDAVLIRQWYKVRAELEAADSMVLPFGADMECDVMGKRPCNEDHVHDMNVMRAMRDAAQSLSPLRKERMGVTNSTVPLFKTLADVVYVPRRLVAEYQELAEHFYKHRVWLEWAVDPIRRALGGTIEGLTEPPVAAMALWAGERYKVFEVMRQEAAMGRNSFIHPLKIGTPGRRERLQKVYQWIWS